MKVAIAHDYLTQRGGAERVVLELCRAFPDAPVYTSLYEPDATYPEFAELDIRPSPMNRIGVLRKWHRLGFVLFPLAFSTREVDADVIVCSSSGWAHGIRTTGRKIVYAHNPPRWLYQTDEYLKGWNPNAAKVMRPVLAVLRKWDRWAAKSADAYIANSSVVRERIEKTYGRDALLLFPPAGVDPSGDQARPAALDAIPEGIPFFLAVARLLNYKRVHDVVEGAASMDEAALVVVGSGPDAERSHRAAEGSDTVFLESVSDAELRWLYSNCLGLVSAAHEDFGLTPVEAASFGRPSVVLRKAGFLDNVDEGVSGVYFDEPEPAQIADALRAAMANDWEPEKIVDYAEGFSATRFRAQIQEWVDELATTGSIERRGSGRP